MSRRFALLALVAVCFVGACGGDDSDESGTDDSAGSDETTQPEASGGEGYTAAIRSNFMNACVAQPGASDAQCECTLDEIAQAVPVEEFVAYDRALQQDPATAPPGWLEEAVTACD
ncbi:MAG TPA: hypothetical protein VKD21_07610 [Acidimicrobiales bacterium]|nr:hypothetical protein [Acidimicrobiales bacterium]